MTWLAFTIAGLATLRVTRLLTGDTITQPLRDKLWTRFPPQPQQSPTGGPGWQLLPDAVNPDVTAAYWRPAHPFGNWTWRMLSCSRWCASIWAAAVVTGLTYAHTPGRVLLTILALSEINGIMWNAAERGLHNPTPPNL